MKYLNVNKLAIIALLSAILMSACVGTKQVAKTTKTKVPKHRKFETFDNDTVAYLLYSFNDRKAKYIGKTVGYMLKDLEINPLVFMPDHSFNHIDTSFGGTFIMRRGKESTQLYISWYPERLSYKILEEIREKYKHKWSKEMKKAIEKQVITEIGAH